MLYIINFEKNIINFKKLNFLFLKKYYFFLKKKEFKKLDFLFSPLHFQLNLQFFFLKKFNYYYKKFFLLKNGFYNKKYFKVDTYSSLFTYIYDNFLIFMKVYLNQKNFQNFFKFKLKIKIYLHSFFLLAKSPWPIFSSFILLFFFLNLVGYLNYQKISFYFLIFFLLIICGIFFFWLRDISRELIYLKKYSILIKKNLRTGFWIFIFSEMFFFFGLFWTFFHFCLESPIQFATLWPPVGLTVNDLFLPFLNTIFLILSGIALNWVQYALISGLFFEVLLGFFFVFLYGFFFIIIQIVEYICSFHQINDSVFGSSLYLLTLFHGLHVIIGLVMLFVCFIKFYKGHFKILDYLGLILSSWYWHFVDIIWIFVFFFVYLWGTWVSDEILNLLIFNFFSNV